MPLTKNPSVRSPQLDTVLMVERFVENRSGEYKKRQLWERLPRKMMYQTFCVVFDYLVHSGKIVSDKSGYIVWIWNPALVKKYMSSSHPRAA